MAPRRASTTIDALEKEFQRKKARELEAAQFAGSGDASSPASAAPRQGGAQRPMPCGSGKKYKKCHGWRLTTAWAAWGSCFPGPPMRGPFGKLRQALGRSAGADRALQFSCESESCLRAGRKERYDCHRDERLRERILV